MAPTYAYPYGTTGSSSQTIWLNWTGNTTDTATTALIWDEWTATTITNTTTNGYTPPMVGFAPSPEQEARRQAQREALAQARERARELLLAVLDDEQQQEFERDGHFHVQTRDGERVYRLKPGSAPLRIKGEDGQCYSYCIHPREAFPAEDTAAALKLMLDADEDAFLRTANASRYAVPAL